MAGNEKKPELSWTEKTRQDLNPHPELEDVWALYMERTNPWITDRLLSGFPLPPETTRKRVAMLKSILTYRSIGVLEEPKPT